MNQFLLYLVSEHGRGEINLLKEIQLLIDARVKVNLLEHYDHLDQSYKAYNTSLHTAAYDHDNADLINILLLHPDINPNLLNNHNQTPLCEAATESNLQNVRALLNNEKTNINIGNPLKSAANKFADTEEYEEDKTILNLLLEHKANSNAKDKNERTALHYATLKNNEEFVRILLEFNANPTLRDNKNKTPADYARNRENKTIEQLLVDAEKNFN